MVESVYYYYYYYYYYYINFSGLLTRIELRPTACTAFCFVFVLFCFVFVCFCLFFVVVGVLVVYFIFVCFVFGGRVFLWLSFVEMLFCFVFCLFLFVCCCLCLLVFYFWGELFLSLRFGV